MRNVIEVKRRQEQRPAEIDGRRADFFLFFFRPGQPNEQVLAENGKRVLCIIIGDCSLSCLGTRVSHHRNPATRPDPVERGGFDRRCNFQVATSEKSEINRDAPNCALGMKTEIATAEANYPKVPELKLLRKYSFQKLNQSTVTYPRDDL